MSQSSALLATAERYLYPNYAKPDVILDRGRGAILWDTEGRRYVDLYAGVAVSVLGHGHPALVEAISTQAQKLMHVANYYHTEPNVLLAERLCRVTGMDRAFFCNSGTEANEGILKLARRYFYAQGQVERRRVIAFENSFHGRTLGALAATGQPKYQEGFGTLSDVTHVPCGDLARVKEAWGPDVAAVIVEAVRGEGGVVPVPAGFLAELRALCDETGALLLADEIQTGFGRTGKFLAFEHAGVQADAVSLAKALGGGFPIGAFVCKEFLKDALPPGSHGTTYGGNPLASAASLAVLDVMEKDGLVERAARLGELLAGRLESLVQKHPRLLAGRRGLGLLQALVLHEGIPAGPLLARFREAGALLILAGPHVVRFCPPLVIEESELEEGLAIVDRVLGETP